MGANTKNREKSFTVGGLWVGSVGSSETQLFFFLALYNSIFHIMINYYELTSCIENSGDPDQLASSGAS